jgi:sulfate adenylyltransferase
MVIWFENIFLRNSAFPGNTEISPYDVTRKEVLAMIEPFGGFVMVYLSTPVDVCERRDWKGLYAKARAGILKDFTGVSDPYEEPNDAEVVINTAEVTPEEAARAIMLHMEREGFIGVDDNP